MGKVFGTKKFRDQAEQETVDIQYPPFPKSLLELIYDGKGIQLSRRANSYVILLGQNFIHADEVNVSKWLFRTYGEKLNSQHFELACTLLNERIRAEIANHQRMTRQAEKEERRTLTSTWGKGDNLNDFFGR
ncbi:hypothetical protein [Acinetobacter guillouiae]|uniref:hypothetical protein n=1 Tax=Acinetobacter guillouiae TaxID=106649 RepID=UPI003AF8F3EA